MYLFKNAFRNTVRNKGKNILIGIIITVITICTCIGLSIHKAASNLVETYIKKNPLKISFQLDMSELRNAEDSVKNDFQSLTIDNIKNYADSKYVKDYYYTLETSVNGSNLTAVENNERPSDIPDDIPNGFKGNNQMGNVGDFRITGYSNFAYLDDFTNGTKKIVEGSMVTGSSEEKEVVISSDLASENNLKLNDEITLISTGDEEKSFTYKIVGIYEDNSDSSSSFMSMNALNGTNQIYTNLNNVQELLDANGTNDDSTKLVANNGLSAKFYLNNNDDLKEFEKSVRSKGLSDYYTVTTNEDEILASLKPIQNLSSFSINFLIVILIIGVVVLTIINFMNIRDRKYEIGVLRAIGMSKLKVTFQLVLEVFFVSIVSLIIGSVIGIITSQPVTNAMLKNEINSYKEETNSTENNFGKGGFERPSQDMGKDFINKDRMKSSSKNTEYVDSLKVKIDISTILQLFGISLLLTSVSSLIASLIINKYNPNKILQNRT